jgi:hypothetical protein
MALLWAAVAACAATGGRPSKLDHLKQLTGTQIQQLLVGRTLYFLPEPNRVMVTSQLREKYLADGTLIIVGDRGATRGTYKVSANHICLNVESLAGEWCRRLFVSLTGQYYFEAIDKENSESEMIGVIIQ